MSWGVVAVTAAVVGTAGAVYGSGAFASPPGSVDLPEYYEDPDYRESQDKLKETGFNMLDGEFNDFYSSLGQTGSKQFEDMLGLAKGDVMQSTSEALAKSGRARGGQLPASTAKAVSDMSIKARFDDYTRAQNEKGQLLTNGLNVVSGVRSAGQAEGGNKNRFAMKQYDAQVAERNQQYTWELDQIARQGAAIQAGSKGVMGFAGEMNPNLGKINATQTTTKDGYWNQNYLDEYFATV